MVAAPGRVSMMTGWPQLSVIFCPITRARMSVDPPGANGTMILIGLSGYLSAGDWAAPAPAASRATAAANVAERIARAILVTIAKLSSIGTCRPGVVFQP